MVRGGSLTITGLRRHGPAAPRLGRSSSAARLRDACHSHARRPETHAVSSLTAAAPSRDDAPSNKAPSAAARDGSLRAAWPRSPSCGHAALRLERRPPPRCLAPPTSGAAAPASACRKSWQSSVSEEHPANLLCAAEPEAFQDGGRSLHGSLSVGAKALLLQRQGR